MNDRLAAALLSIGILTSTSPVEDVPPRSADAIRLEFLAKHCISCHGPETHHGDLRLDTAPYDLNTGEGRARWRLVLDRIAMEEMPPPEAPTQPTRSERDAVVRLVRADLDEAAARFDTGVARSRRLDRIELLNTVRDLFGIRGIKLPASYPDDVTERTHDATPSGAEFSSAHLAAMMELAADVAGRMVFLPAQRVTSQSNVTALTQQPSMWIKEGDEGGRYFTGVNNAAWCGAAWDRRFAAPESGTYTVEIRASAGGSEGADGKPLRLGFYALFPGDYYIPESANRLSLPRVGSLDVPASPESLVLQCAVELEQGEGFHVYCENRLPDSQPQGPLSRIDIAQLFMAAVADPRPIVRIESMNVTGPVAPLTRQVAFLGGRARPASDEDFLRSVLLPLAERAFRRPLNAIESRDVIEPVMRQLREMKSPELALRFGIRRILLSPEFHFLDLPESRNDGHAQASRLSYFLWSSMPDAELLGLAATG